MCDKKVNLEWWTVLILPFNLGKGDYRLASSPSSSSCLEDTTQANQSLFSGDVELGQRASLGLPGVLDAYMSNQELGTATFCLPWDQRFQGSWSDKKEPGSTEATHTERWSSEGSGS